ncbi:MAG: ATP synthase F1 subunit epsilon [Bradyrhizobiaceae bacterium]|nr:ATP synthase F1 subunit epsilon [Bradyrhizobiaceae bacterium]
MDHILTVSIVTPRATAFEGTALAVSVPGSHSPFQILFNHAPIISSLEIGVLKIEEPNNHVHVFAAREGFVEVMRNKVNIVVEDLVPASSIDEASASSNVSEARARWNEATDRASRAQHLRDLHWAEACERAAKLFHEKS